MNAQDEADRIFTHLLGICEAIKARFGKAQSTPISIYETDHDLATLRPEDGGAWTAAFHREVMELIAVRLRVLGYPVRLVTLHAADYLRWLAAKKLTNTPAHRAQFISLQ